MLDAGAALLQVYTGYIYAGPALVADLNRLVPHDHQGEHPMTSSYGDRLSAAVAQRGPLCVGIDPHPAILQAWGLSVDAAGLERCARGMVEALGETVAVFKPQSAFFEAHGSAGIAVLERTLADIAGFGRAGAAGREAGGHRLDHGRVRRRVPHRRLAAGRRRRHPQSLPRLRARCPAPSTWR